MLCSTTASIKTTTLLRREITAKSVVRRLRAAGKLIWGAVLLNLVVSSSLLPSNGVPASPKDASHGASDGFASFAGAEGYGAAASGGRGGIVVHVTSLADHGEGTLRWAVESLSGPRTIIFDIGGTISLKSQILLKNGDVTIAGQTAPGEGIVIEGSRLRIAASNVIVRGLHFRPGDGAGSDPDDRDGLMVGSQDKVLSGIIIDHNSFAWAIDENVAINGKVENLTFSNNIVAEALSNSLHSKGEHSKGLLVSNWNGVSGDNNRITIIKNLFSDNVQRNPEIRAGQHIEVINNYIYNYGLAHIGIAIGGASDGREVVTANITGNVLTPGNSTPGRKSPIFMNDMHDASHVTLVDNLYTALPTDTNGNQDQARLYWNYGYQSQGTISYALGGSSTVTILDSMATAAYVLANAGALNGRGRDSVDRRIINEATTGSGRTIHKVSDVYDAQAARKLTIPGAMDSDRDGMPDWFEDRYGFNRRAADNNGDNDGDGFTNLEEYINGIITGFDLGSAAAS